MLPLFSFIETRLFTRIVGEHLSDDEYAELQMKLATDPEVGSVIRGSGGIRKLRWAGRGRGKRGGLRIIYYVKIREGVIWLLTIYAKSEAETISKDVLDRIRKEIDG